MTQGTQDTQANKAEADAVEAGEIAALSPAERLQKAREQIFSDKYAKPTVVEFVFHDVQLEWRQPPIESIQRTEDREERENRNFMVQMMIDNSYIPGTDELVFSDADYEDIQKMPLNGEFRKVIAKIASAIGLDVDDKVKN